MPSWLFDIVFPLFRWLHIVCTTLIVGGTLFFELVLPIAIEDLKNEERLLVMARARWVFRWVVWISVTGLLVSGVVNLAREWKLYQASQFGLILRLASTHMIIGGLSLFIALLLTIGRRPPEDPIRWMRLDLVLLLVTIFLGSTSRYMEMALYERGSARGKLPPATAPIVETPSTQSATSPAAP
jgi:uncharacterized membrane protein